MPRSSVIHYIKTDGSLWATGENAAGEIGNGTTTTVFAPVQITSPSKTWAQVCGGDQSTFALAEDGTIWTWGQETAGEHGLGTTTAQHSTPQQIGVATDWIFINRQHQSSFAINSSGELYAWGENGAGQLGTADLSNKATPAQVGTDTDWSAVVNGDTRTYALKTTGTLWHSGTGSLNTFVQQGTDTDWLFIAAADDGGLFIKNDGTVYCDGFNYDNRFTSQFAEDSEVSGPTLLTDANLTDIRYAALGSRATADEAFAFYVKNNGTAYSVGDGGTTINGGWLGLGDTNDRAAATIVGSDTDWHHASAAHYCSYLLKTNGALYGAGYHTLGAIGQGVLPPATVIYSTHTLIDTSVISSYSYAARQAATPGATLSYSEEPQYYTLTLTGAADSTTDLLLPISSVSYRVRTTTEALSVSVPWTQAYADGIAARPNGDLVLNFTQGSTSIDLVTIAPDTIRYDLGANNRSITIRADQSPPALSNTLHVVPATSINYQRSGDGDSWRLAPLPQILVGDTVQYGNQQMITDGLSIFVNSDVSQMEITGAVIAV